MKNISAFLLVSAILISTLFSQAQNRSIKFEESKWNDLLKKAQKEKKIIFLDCYTSWCMPCKWMALNVFTNDTVADFYKANFINVGMDMEKGEGLELRKKYGISSYPTMLYLNPDGEQLHRVLGKSNVQTLIDNGKVALDPQKQLAFRAQKFNQDPSNAELAFFYFEMLLAVDQPHNVEVERYFSTQKESNLTSRANWKIIYDHSASRSSKMPENNTLKVFRFLETNRSVFAELYTNDSVESVIDNVYNYELYYATVNKDKAEFELLKTNYRKSKTAKSEKVIMYADLHYFESEKDWNNYALTAVEYIEKFASKNRHELSNDAYVFYYHVDDKKMLEKAEQWAKKAVDIDSNNEMYNIIYASVLCKLGKKSEAKVAAENALAIAKKNGDDHKETDELLNKINALK